MLFYIIHFRLSLFFGFVIQKNATVYSQDQGFQRIFTTWGGGVMQLLLSRFCRFRINLTLMTHLAAGVKAVCTTAIETL